MRFSNFKIVPNGIDFQPFESKGNVITVTALMDEKKVSIVFVGNKLEACSIDFGDDRDEFEAATKLFLNI